MINYFHRWRGWNDITKNKKLSKILSLKDCGKNFNKIKNLKMILVLNGYMTP